MSIYTVGARYREDAMHKQIVIADAGYDLYYVEEPTDPENYPSLPVDYLISLPDGRFAILREQQIELAEAERERLERAHATWPHGFRHGV